MDSAILVAPGNSAIVADADVSVRMLDGTLGTDADPATGAAAGPRASPGCWCPPGMRRIA
ncbi:MAG: hypothetical protein R3C32_03425 [Chloroflexota bacterium]